MTPSIRRTAITKKVSVVNIAVTHHHPFQTSLNFYTLGNASSPPSFGDDRANMPAVIPVWLVPAAKKSIP